jgi:hypothetical protein
MLRAHFRHLAVVASVGLVVGLVGAATAQGACGGNVLLGATNSCNSTTGLTGSLNGNLLNLTNTNTGASAVAIRGDIHSILAAVVGNNTGAGAGVLGSSSSSAASAEGVFGRLTSTAPGSGSSAVRGHVYGTNGNGYGVYGSHAGSGTGVRGVSVGGTGLFGLHSAGSGTDPGVEGDTKSTAGGRGVFGLHSAVSGTGPGVEGQTKSTAESAAGVVGKVVPIGPGGFSAGVRGINNGIGSLGIGVWGSHAGDGWGVFGESPTGIGVRGSSGSGTGVAAQAAGAAPALTADNVGGGPAAAFTTNGGAPFTVDSSERVDDLNADQLDGRTAAALGGRAAVAGDLGYFNHTDGTYAERASITIDAPAVGLMLVTGSVVFDTFLGGDTSCGSTTAPTSEPCIGLMRLRDKVNDVPGGEQVASFGDGIHESGTQLASTWVFIVEAGERKFALDTIGEVPDEVFADNATLTALFVPFGPFEGRPAASATTSAVTTKTVRSRRR